MGIDAIAVLRGKDIPLPEDALLRTLDDGALVMTVARFTADNEQMALALRLRLGDSLDAHHDDRGVFLYPDVAEPRSTTYEGVLAEIGDDAGVWVPVVGAGHVPSSMASAPTGSFASIMSEVMGALGGEGTFDRRGLPTTPRSTQTVRIGSERHLRSSRRSSTGSTFDGGRSR